MWAESDQKWRSSHKKCPELGVKARCPELGANPCTENYSLISDLIHDKFCFFYPVNVLPKPDFIIICTEYIAVARNAAPYQEIHDTGDDFETGNGDVQFPAKIFRIVQQAGSFGAARGLLPVTAGRVDNLFFVRTKPIITNLQCTVAITGVIRRGSRNIYAFEHTAPAMIGAGRKPNSDMVMEESPFARLFRS